MIPIDLNIVAVIILAVWFLRLQRYDYFPEYPRIRRDFYPFVSVSQRTREAGCHIHVLFKENQRPHDYGDFYIIWHSEPGKLEQINQINQSKSMS